MSVIDGANAHGAGLGAGARLPISAPSPRGVQCRAVAVRALYLAVPSQSGGAPAVPPAHARAAVAFTREARVTSIDGATAPGAGFRGEVRLPGSASSLRSAERRTAPVRALYLAVPSQTTLVLQPCLQPTPALLWH